MIDEGHHYSLAEVLDMGLLYNTNTKETWAQARAAAAQYGQSLQNYFILSQFDSSYQRARSPGFAFNENYYFFYTLVQNQLNFSYTFLDFGQTRNSSLSALYSLYEADWSHNHQIQSVIQTLMSDYFNVIYQQELLLSDIADVENAEATLISAEEKLRMGTTDISDVLQARTTYLENKLRVVNQQQSVAGALSTITNDMGIPSNTRLQFERFPSEYELYQPRAFEDLFELAKQCRPDYLAAIAEVQSKEYALNAAKSQYYPTVNGDFSIGNSRGNGGFNDQYDFSAQVSLTLPLFQGFFQKNQIKQAEANLENSKANALQTELTITKEINLYQQDVTFALDSIEYATAYLDSAKEDFKVSLDKYRQGTNNIIDVINAQTSVADASAKVISAKNDYFTALANLSYAIGSLNLDPTKLSQIIEEENLR